MGDFFVYLAEQYKLAPSTVLFVFFVVYLTIEFGLDIAHDLVLDWWREKRKK